MSDLEPIRDVEFRNAVNELREKIKNSDLEIVSCYCSGCDTILDFGSFDISFDKIGIWCYDYFNHQTIWIDENVPFRKAKTHFKELPKLILPNSSFKLYFLENLKEITASIERKIKKAETNKYSGMSEIDETIIELSKEPEQSVALPAINMIDFGYRTIEIITNGDVVLVDKRVKQSKFIDAESLLISKSVSDKLIKNKKKRKKVLHKRRRR